MPPLANMPTADLGILGTGRMGPRLAATFARAGRSVLLGSRSPDRARRIAAELDIPGLSGGSYDDALRAGAVLPAIFIRDGLLPVLEGAADRLSGKLLVDISNPFNEDYSDFITPWDSSGAELVARAAPKARLVAAFKNVFWEVFDSPLFAGEPSDVLVAGDDDGAKSAFLDLARGTPFRYLDAGPLVHARTIERMTPITGRLGRHLGAYPRMNWRLLTQPEAVEAAA